jgi:hypothetical protein
MPHIQLSHSAPAGPLIDVYVTVSGPRHKALTAAGAKVPPAQFCKALVDTGASNTSIDPSVMGALGLTPTGSTPVITPTTGAVPVNQPTFDVGVHVQFANKQFHSKNPLTVTSASFSHQGFMVLLGRDILANGLLIYDGVHKTFCLSF